MNEKYDRQTTVVTSEHVSLHLQTAGVGSRAAALLIDFLLLSVLFGLTILFLGTVLMIAGIEWSPLLEDYLVAFVILFSAILFGAYFIFTEYYWAGQSPGKNGQGCV
jgi:uncharacterized RDD family membrane protein YckC